MQVDTPKSAPEEYRKLREEQGMGLIEARRELERRSIQRAIESPFWFLHLRSILAWLLHRTT